MTKEILEKYQKLKPFTTDRAIRLFTRRDKLNIRDIIRLATADNKSNIMGIINQETGEVYSLSELPWKDEWDKPLFILHQFKTKKDNVLFRVPSTFSLEGIVCSEVLYGNGKGMTMFGSNLVNCERLDFTIRNKNKTYLVHIKGGIYEKSTATKGIYKYENVKKDCTPYPIRELANQLTKGSRIQLIDYEGKSKPWNKSWSLVIYPENNSNPIICRNNRGIILSQDKKETEFEEFRR